jgi:hypothetical protein
MSKSASAMWSRRALWSTCRGTVIVTSSRDGLPSWLDHLTVVVTV